jgi:hypothetical protein
MCSENEHISNGILKKEFLNLPLSSMNESEDFIFSSGYVRNSQFNGCLNHTNWRPAENTLWLGTRALREPATIDSDPYLAPDLRYILQPRVGMPAGRTPRLAPGPLLCGILHGRPAVRQICRDCPNAGKKAGGFLVPPALRSHLQRPAPSP